MKEKIAFKKINSFQSKLKHKTKDFLKAIGKNYKSLYV